MTAPEEIKYGLDLSGVDPASLGEALATAGAQIARHPLRLSRAFAALGLEATDVMLDVARKLLAVDGEPVAKPDPDDRRFSDRAWTENPFLRGWLESYLVTGR